MIRLRLRLVAATAIVALASMLVAHALDLTPTKREVAAFLDRVVSVTAPDVVAAPVPRWNRVYVVMFENREFDEIIGVADAPYLNELADRGAVAINTYDVADASLPNYLALTSGEVHLVTDNFRHDIDALSLFDQLEAAGRSWRVFAEQVPPGCFTGETASGGRDGSGDYLRAHQPAISYRSISGTPERCANIQDFTAFDPVAADYELIVPDMCNKMHDCPVATGDEWLSRFAPKILDAPTFWTDSLLVIAFDEGGSSQSADGHHIVTIVVGAGVSPGTVSQTVYNHYNVLRTIQEGLGLPCLARSCKADTMADLFVGPSAEGSP
jgi:hypothetical protein